MRKIYALAMITILSLTFALAVVGCGGKKTEETTTTPPAEQTTPAPAESAGGAMTDTMHHDSTMAK